ncbi:helix-turn-helix domain-containing protein [Marinobacter salarius]|uniref:AlbA family DNA-binding domain-containing protein n=1 Tax=Marinobacter salarius TaxID=1420917 RepID=UPI003BAD214F
MSLEGYDLTKINKEMHLLIEKGTIGKDPVLLLQYSNGFIPKEGWLWDYKKDVGDDRVGLAKTILQIVSFHNTCGGYLIYGVEEVEKDQLFSPIGFDPAKFNQAKIRDLIGLYTGSKIEFHFDSIDVDFLGDTHKFGILHVPKRLKNEPPVQFIKRGPEKKNGFIFDVSDVYLRVADECKKSEKPEDWQLLYSDRDIQEVAGIDFNVGAKSSNLPHNLPDKHLICPKLIGREEIVSKLWEWLSDPFEYSKILAGDGGKGKTSIAYHFACQFVESPPYAYTNVIWLSAKEKQFSGFGNEYYELKESDYSSSETFLAVLASHVGRTSTECEGIALVQLKKLVFEGLKTFPSLIVVDDVDSVPDEEQKRIVDYCRQLGGENTRFLITTRKKFAYSSDLCIEVPGLPMDEYIQFIENQERRYKIAPITKKDARKMHVATDGSPLLSDSILRMVKIGESLQESIRGYKGQAGEDARDAALSKEIGALSVDARRALLAIVYFKSCSKTELKQVLGYEKLRLQDCLEELQSLFLISEPKLIENESRFTTSATTSMLVLDKKSELAFDHTQLEKKVRELRKGVPFQKKEGNRKKVGQAITQAMAFLKDLDFQSALDTINSELKNQKDNPDLLLFKGRILFDREAPDVAKARSLFRKSYDLGQRKSLIFDYWFDAEEKSSSANGMIEVAGHALREQVSDKASWHYKYARGLIIRSRARDGVHKVDDLLEASSSLSKVIRDQSAASRQLRIQESNELHDLIWHFICDLDSISWISGFDYINIMISNGDSRTVMYQRAHSCLKEVRAELSIRFSDKKKEAYDIKVKQFKNILGSRSDTDQNDRPFDDLLVGLEA